MNQLAHDINQDIICGYTPDLPSLRYSRSTLKVFLWDQLKDFNSYNKVLKAFKANVDYRIKHFEAKTQTAFLPVCLRETKGGPEYHLFQHQKEHPDVAWPFGSIKGKVMECSLDVLQALDIEYGNEYTYTRKKINLSTSVGGKNLCTAWVYITNPAFVTLDDWPNLLKEKKITLTKPHKTTDGLYAV